MAVDLDLIRADANLVLTPRLMEKAELGILDLSDYVGLLLRDLADSPDPFEQALSLIKEGNVALARRFLLENKQLDLNQTQLSQFEEHRGQIRKGTQTLLTEVSQEIINLQDSSSSDVLSTCLALYHSAEKNFEQDRYHLTWRELVLTQNILRDEVARQVKVEDKPIKLDQDQVVSTVVPEESEPFHASLAPEEAPKPVLVLPPKSPDLTLRADLLEEAISAWQQLTSNISGPMKALLRPSTPLTQRPSYYAVFHAAEQVLLEEDHLSKAQAILKQYFYLTKGDQQQLEKNFQGVLLVYALERIKEFIHQKDFNSANQTYEDTIQLLRDAIRPRVLSSDIYYDFHQYGFEARTGLMSEAITVSLKKFEKQIEVEIRNLPSCLPLTDREARKILDYSKVMFFFYRTQTYWNSDDYADLIHFYREHNTVISSLTTGNLELNRFYETATNYYEESCYRQTTSELTESNLPLPSNFEETLYYVRELETSQVVSGLRSIQENFRMTAGTHPLMQMYHLLLLLFEMEEPEELVFAQEQISGLIDVLISTYANDKNQISLIGDESLHIGILKKLKIFVQEGINAVSVTDFALGRQHIAYALENLREQRDYITYCGSVTRKLWHRLGDHWISIFVARQRAMSRRTSLRLTFQSEEVLANEPSPIVVYLQNLGPGVARNISIAITSSDLNIVSDRMIFIPILSDGDEYTDTIIVQPRNLGSKQVEIKLLIRYYEAKESGIITSESRSLVLKNTATEKFPQNSPYVWGQPLGPDTRVFYGREEVFEFLKTRFWGEERNKIIALQGERRMGKTSILYQLKSKKIFGDYRVVYFDFQARYANIDSMQEFLFLFARRIRSEAQLSADLQVSRSDFLLGQREYYEVFETWLDRVEEELATHDRQIVIVFDEFEKLLSRRFEDSINVNQRLVDELLQYLRSIMLVRKRFNWIITGSWSLVTKQREYFSSLFGMALSYWISFLRRDDAINLIQEPVKRYLTYDQNAIERIFRLTGGHPYHIQIMCDELFNRARKNNSHQVRLRDINMVIEHTLKQVTEANFSIIWTSLHHPLSRKVLASVAEAMQKPEIYVKKQEIFRYLSRRSPSVSEDAFYKVLDMEDGELMKRELIESHLSNPERLRIKSELLYLWLIKAKPLSKVLQDER